MNVKLIWESGNCKFGVDSQFFTISQENLIHLCPNRKLVREYCLDTSLPVLKMGFWKLKKNFLFFIPITPTLLWWSWCLVISCNGGGIQQAGKCIPHPTPKSQFLLLRNINNVPTYVPPEVTFGCGLERVQALKTLIFMPEVRAVIISIVIIVFVVVIISNIVKNCPGDFSDSCFIWENNSVAAKVNYSSE